MPRKKKCPVCGLTQAEALDCASCAASLITVPLWEEPADAGADAGNEAAEGSPDASCADASCPAGRPGADDPRTAQADELSRIGRTPRMIVQGEGGIRITVASGDILGRSAVGAEHFAGHPTVSRRHAKLSFEAGRWFLEDMNSTNGILVEGKRVSRARLELGDSFSLSSTCTLTVAKC